MLGVDLKWANGLPFSNEFAEVCEMNLYPNTITELESCHGRPIESRVKPKEVHYIHWYDFKSFIYQKTISFKQMIKVSIFYKVNTKSSVFLTYYLALFAITIF